MTASPPIGLDQNTLMVELPSLVVTVKSMGGLGAVGSSREDVSHLHFAKWYFLLPLIKSCAESDVLPLPTVHVYSLLSLPVTFRVWMYRGKV